jgi:hypothetical protein
MLSAIHRILFLAGCYSVRSKGGGLPSPSGVGQALTLPPAEILAEISQKEMNQ